MNRHYQKVCASDGNATLIQTSTGTWQITYNGANRPIRFENAGTQTVVECGYDIRKNVCEVFGPAGYIRTAYSYAPFGFVTEFGDVSQPFQWSSEHYDSELDLVYYNYRHYSPTFGRFLSRDPIEEQGGRNLYAFVKNNPNAFFDERGGSASLVMSGGLGIGLWIGTGAIVGIATVVGISAVLGLVAIGVISIIDSIPTSDAQAEEDTEEKTDAVPIEKCEPCEDTKRKKCAPCDPPKDTVMLYAYHTDHSHGGMQPHFHYHRVNQNKQTCVCFKNRHDPYTTADPLPCAIPRRPVTGGGFLP